MTTITISNDLQIEILLRLPPKSLIRFKSVCKRWFSLISGHHFSNRHTLHHRRRAKPKPSLLLLLLPALYLYLQRSFHKLAPYTFSPALVGPITIRSVSNGLFVLQCRHVENPFQVFHVHNPTTKQSRKILLNVHEIYVSVLGLNIVFDPLESPHYKVICVRGAQKGASFLSRSWWRRCQIEVYESETSSWKLCGEPFSAPRGLNFDGGVYLEGAIHWQGVFLDLGEYVVRNHPEIVVPGETRTEDFRDYYIESNGCLHNVKYLHEKKLVMVFELKGDYSEWLLKYRVDVDGACGPLSVLNIDDGMLVLYEPGKVIIYDLQGNRLKELDFRAEAFCQGTSAQFAFDRTFQFVETLAPV